MAQTIEDVNGRTLLQQFHSLYKKQDAIETNVENVDAKVEQEKSDRQTADANLQKAIYQEATERGNETASLRNEMNTNTNKIEYNATQISALKSDKQDKLTAGTNITIDENNVISASGGISSVKAENVDSESATSGQVLTADGSGGASWQNAGGEKWYQHNIVISKFSSQICILSKSSTSFTATSLNEWLWENNYKQATPYTVNYIRIWENAISTSIGVYATSSSGIPYIRVSKTTVNSTIDNNVISNSYSTSSDFISVSENAVDTVTEL